MNKRNITADKAAFGKLVRKHRKSKKYTQEQLASLIDIQPKSISFIERGINFPSPENIFKIAKVLDISLDEFVFGYSKLEPNLTNEELNEMIVSLEGEDRAFFVTLMKATLNAMNERRK